VYHLPRTWRWVTLDNLQADEPRAITDGPFGSNLTSAHYRESGARVVRLQNIGDGVFKESEAFISWEHYQLLARHAVKPGDLLVASLGETLPRACLAPESLGPAIVKADCIRVRLGTQVEPRWVVHALQTDVVRRWAQGQLHGVGRPRLGLKVIRALPIPLPPLREQRRIVEILEDHLSRLDFAAAGLDRCQVALPVMRLAFLKGERNRLLAEGVDVRRIGDTCQTSLGKMLDAKRARGLQTPYLRNINVRWGRIDLTDVLNVPLTENERARLSLVPGDLLVCEGGEPGRCAVWWGGADASIMTFQKALHRIRVNGSGSTLRPTYVAAMLEELVRSGRADLIFTGTTIKHLPQEKLRMLEILVPPVQEQDRILEGLDSLSASAERLSANVRASMTRAHQLRRSLLSAAFSGRLTSRTGHDEVAEELASV